MPRQQKSAECVFHKGFTTESIDPEVDKLWKIVIGGRTPFGDLRNTFRRHHCRVLNPYGDSENCPYSEMECAYAFRDSVEITLRARPKKPVGYFLRVTRRMAAERADAAVDRKAAAARLRGTEDRTPVQLAPPPTTEPNADPRGVGGASPTGAPTRPGDPDPLAAGGGLPPGRGAPGNGAGGSEADAGLPRRGGGPVSLGDLLGSLEARSREAGGEGRGQGRG